MDGLLVVDKPVGPTSHDVVARARRLLGERRVGHAGTLDPRAGGVLVLLVGRATRLAQFLSDAGKTYEAAVRLGVRTDSYDQAGSVVGTAYEGPYPGRDEIDRALDACRGTFLQQPPLFSAKKVGGKRSYKTARAHARLRDEANRHSSVLAGSGISSGAGAPPPVPLAEGSPSLAPALPAPPALPAHVSVTVHRLDVLSVADGLVTLTIDCSAGFYVRSLAHDLGERLGIGAHLAALRRTRSGQFTLDDAAGLEALERHPDDARMRLVPLARILPELASVVLTSEGVRRAIHGRDLGPEETEHGVPPESVLIRLLDADGDLVGIAQPGAAPGLLHPSVVLK